MASAFSVPALVAWTVVFSVGAYAVCGIPFGLIIAEKLGHVDVRSQGSGNIGTTNVARSVGKTAAALTLLLDLGKGLAWMLFSRFMLSLIVFGQAGFAEQLGFQSEWGVSMSVVYMFCVLGHVYSPYLNFHGGKGIAVGFGAALGLWWPIALAALAIFFLAAVPTRYVSLGSIITAIMLPIQCALWGFPAESVWPVAVVALVVVWAHRENVKKLVSGTERKFEFHEKGAEKSAEEEPAAKEAEVAGLAEDDEKDLAAAGEPTAGHMAAAELDEDAQPEEGEPEESGEPAGEGGPDDGRGGKHYAARESE